MNDYYNKSLFSLVSATLLLAACGGTPNRDEDSGSRSAPYEVIENYTTGVISYTVQRNDRLGDIALEFTGSSSNWPAIARHNNITNPTRLQEGQVIEIPTELIPERERPSSVPNIQAEAAPTSPAVQTPALALRQDAVEAEAVIITPISINRDFQLNPIDPNAAPEPVGFTGSGTQVKVIGTYYPKGIYSEPAAYSTLMMRVAPGTLFSVISQVNDWYRIETTSGKGYIRISDAAIVE